MDIKLAILFYSQRNSESLRIKKICENYDINIEKVCLDNKKIRKKIMNNNVYDIHQIPSILLIYSNKDYELLDGYKLKEWITAIVDNINHIKQQEQEQYMKYLQEQYQINHPDKSIQETGSINTSSKTNTGGYQTRTEPLANAETMNTSGGTATILDLSDNTQQQEAPKKKKDAKEEKKNNLEEMQKRIQQEREKILDEESMGMAQEYGANNNDINIQIKKEPVQTSDIAHVM